MAHDATPVLQTFFLARAIESHHGARTHYRHDVPHTELDRFLQGVVHALAARDRLHQGDVQRRFVGARAMLRERRAHFAARHRDESRLILAAATVEQHHLRIALEAQHIAHMVSGGGGQHTFAAAREFDIDIDAWHGGIL